MASFHYEIKSGRNGDDHGCYVARTGYHGKRSDLVTASYGNLPAWAEGSPRKLWKAAEKFERKNGAVYREAVIALPGVLTLEQNAALVDDIVSKLAASKPYQLAVHAPISSLEGQCNPHLHLMTSDRVDDGIERPAERFFSRYNAKSPEKGGRKKDSGGRNRMQVRNELIAKRKVVADTINHHLALHGHDARVDHRKLREQGIARKPERHLGPARIRGMSAGEKADYVTVRRVLKDDSQKT